LERGVHRQVLGNDERNVGLMQLVGVSRHRWHTLCLKLIPEVPDHSARCDVGPQHDPSAHRAHDSEHVW
jgi:hypothetical protein